jgi:hypothetical protein
MGRIMIRLILKMYLLPLQTYEGIDVTSSRGSLARATHGTHTKSNIVTVITN